MFTVASNQTGPWGALRFLGGAKIVDPDGAVLARAPALARAWRSARVDIAAASRESRAIIDHLADRRAEAYGAMPCGGRPPQPADGVRSAWSDAVRPREAPGAG